MRVSSVVNNVNFGNVYAVYGSKHDLKRFDKKIMKNNNKKDAFVKTVDATDFYKKNWESDDLYSVVLSNSATNGNEIRFYVTGSKDCAKASSDKMGLSWLSHHIDKPIKATRDIPLDFAYEFTKSAHDIEIKK